MYLVCLTGTLATIAETLERWEQPNIEEFELVTPAAVLTAIEAFRTEVENSPSSLWIVFPTPELPRMHIAGDEHERFIRSDGTLDEAPVERWTHMLRELHIKLHLPQTLGLVIVSALGAMLISLIISGLISHPRIFKDAFKLRIGGSRHLEQADLHNRLSVWALPFHLMIAVTGAFYGLVGVLAFSAAAAWYDGDQDALFDAVFGADPVLANQSMELRPNEAMRQLKELHPLVSPIYLVAHNLDTQSQFMEIAATVPDRLAYSEIYRFDAQGNYLGSQELTTGPAGRQFLYSLYRIHFGYFGGQWTRIIWFILGLLLTVVSVTGINVWLAKRNMQDSVDRAWKGFVWGTPLALTSSAFASIFFHVEPLWIFAACTLLCVGLLARSAADEIHAIWLYVANGIALAVLASCHWWVFDPQVFGNYLYWVNGALFVSAISFLTLGAYKRIAALESTRKNSA